MDPTRRLPFPGEGIEAVVFDLDGVVTDTAGVHEAAWKSVFDEFLRSHAEQTGSGFAPFTAEEYGRYVDGKPRYDGAASFIASRDIDLPLGDPSDPPGDTSVAALANRKNERFLTVLAEQGVEPYPGSVRVIRELRAAGVQVGLITSSRNGRAVLRAAGVTSLFNAIIDGVDAADAGLAGKPEPDVFIAATLLLGTTPERTAIVEDSQAGCSAGREAGFGLVLGVDRLGMAEELVRAGAHAVVQDLDELTVTTTGTRLAAAGRVAARPGDAGAQPPRTPAQPGAADEAPEGAIRAEAAAGRPPLLSSLPSALDAAAWLADRLRDRTPVVFLDFDGTLAEIVGDPAAAAMTPDVAQSVERIAAVTPVAIVSGRDLNDVRERAGVGGVHYAGSHGFEIAGPDGTIIDTGHDEEFGDYLPALDEAEAVLRRELGGLDGVIVERKRFAIAVHFRMASPGVITPIEAVVRGIRDDLGGRLRVTGGKKIFELRPDVEWDKGAAIEVLLHVPGLGGDDAVPVYLGDDLTDEDAFRAVLAHDGIAIAVQGEEDRPTSATYGLHDPAQVGEFLDLVTATVSGARKQQRS